MIRIREFHSRYPPLPNICFEKTRGVEISKKYIPLRENKGVSGVPLFKFSKRKKKRIQNQS